jgi:DNA polymerase-3 subunit alpha
MAHEIESFEPSEDEVARARVARAPEPVVLRIDARAFGAGLVDELKAIFENFPGETEVLLEMETRDGQRRLRFGDGYRVQPTPALRAELDALLGIGARAA